MSNYQGPNKVARWDGEWQGQAAWLTGMWLISEKKFKFDQERELRQERDRLEALFWKNHGPGAEP